MRKFRVKFKCSNCGKRWTRKFKPKKRIEKDIGFLSKGVKVYNGERLSKKLEETIECPTCKLKDTISICNRTPVI